MDPSRPLPSSLDGTGFSEESGGQKILRRLKEEPLVPLGCALTCLALLKATRSIRAGTKEQTNRMFRMRIYAQGFTLFAMIGGSYYYAKEREARKEWEQGVREQKTDEKREAWIKELELRDEEEKEFREKARKLAERRKVAEKGIAELAMEAAVKRKDEGKAEKIVVEVPVEKK